MLQIIGIYSLSFLGTLRPKWRRQQGHAHSEMQVYACRVFLCHLFICSSIIFLHPSPQLAALHASVPSRTFLLSVHIFLFSRSPSHPGVGPILMMSSCLTTQAKIYFQISSGSQVPWPWDRNIIFWNNGATQHFRFIEFKHSKSFLQAPSLILTVSLYSSVVIRN